MDDLSGHAAVEEHHPRLATPSKSKGGPAPPVVAVVPEGDVGPGQGLPQLPGEEAPFQVGQAIEAVETQEAEHLRHRAGSGHLVLAGGRSLGVAVAGAGSTARPAPAGGSMRPTSPAMWLEKPVISPP